MTTITRKLRGPVPVVVIVIVIAVALYATIKRTSSSGDSEAGYEYTAYAVDEDGTYYAIPYRGAGLTFPVEYKGKTLKALYCCSSCGHLFHVEPAVMTMYCLKCSKPTVGAYDPDIHGEVAGPIDAKRIKIQ